MHSKAVKGWSKAAPTIVKGLRHGFRIGERWKTLAG
jgi:hypothetical protein